MLVNSLLKKKQKQNYGRSWWWYLHEQYTCTEELNYGRSWTPSFKNDLYLGKFYSLPPQFHSSHILPATLIKFVVSICPEWKFWFHHTQSPEHSTDLKEPLLTSIYALMEWDLLFPYAVIKLKYLVVLDGLLRLNGAVPGHWMNEKSKSRRLWMNETCKSRMCKNCNLLLTCYIFHVTA